MQVATIVTSLSRSLHFYHLMIFRDIEPAMKSHASDYAKSDESQADISIIDGYRFQFSSSAISAGCMTVALRFRAGAMALLAIFQCRPPRCKVFSMPSTGDFAPIMPNLGATTRARTRFKTYTPMTRRAPRRPFSYTADSILGTVDASFPAPQDA